MDVFRCIDARAIPWLCHAGLVKLSSLPLLQEPLHRHGNGAGSRLPSLDRSTRHIQLFRQPCLRPAEGEAEGFQVKPRHTQAVTFSFRHDRRWQV